MLNQQPVTATARVACESLAVVQTALVRFVVDWLSFVFSECLLTNISTILVIHDDIFDV